MAKVYFSQRDPRWGNKMYSSVGNAKQTIKSSGCGPTCTAMIISSLTDTIIYPDSMANQYVASGYRTVDNGTYWSAFSNTASKYGLEFKQTSDSNTAMDCVRNGGMVIINARGGANGLFTFNGHYLVLVGIQGDKFVIYDPDVYNGKYNTSARKAKVTVNGNELYVSIENVKIETRQYFCYYTSGKETPGTDQTKAKYVRVETSLNIRSGAGVENARIGGLNNNTLVTVYEEANGFSRIGEGKWVSSQYLQDAPSVSYTSKVMTVIAKSGLNVRENPNNGAKIVTAYPKGTRVTIYEIKNGWAKGIKGWMYAKYLA